MSIRAQWLMGFAAIAVLLTMFGLMRSDMSERFAETQSQLDRRFAEVLRAQEELRRNQDKLLDSHTDVRERLATLERMVGKQNEDLKRVVPKER